SSVAVPEPTRDALNVAALAAASRQADNVSAVDVADRLGITDAFFFASAETERQVKSVIEEIEDDMRERLELRPIRREVQAEGKAEGRWVLLDYEHFVVHVQHEEERENYALDRLWADAPQIELPEAE